MVLAAAMGLLMLNACRQSIRGRFQSEAFPQNQFFFLELNRYSFLVLHYYRQHHAKDLKNELRVPETEILLQSTPTGMWKPA